MIYEATYRDVDGHEVGYTRQMYATSDQRAIDNLIHHEYFLLKITNLTKNTIVLE